MKITNNANGMKSIFTKPIAFLLMASFLLINYGCNRLDPFQGVQLTVNSGIAVPAPSIFYVLNAENAQPIPELDGTVVEITGKNADRIFSAGGSKTIKITKGVIQASLQFGLFDIGDISYQIKITAPGYLPMLYPVQFPGNSIITRQIYLVPENSNKIKYPYIFSEGISDANGRVTKGGGCFVEDVYGYILGEGAILTDKQGQPMQGTVNIKIIANQPVGESMISSPTFFGGANGDNTIKDTNGNMLPETTILPLFVHTITVKVDGKDVDNIGNSKNSSILAFPINAVTGLNPLTGVNFNENDRIAILARKQGTNEWIKIDERINKTSTSISEHESKIPYPGEYVHAIITKPATTTLTFSSDGLGPFTKARFYSKTYLSINATVDYYDDGNNVLFSEKVTSKIFESFPSLNPSITLPLKSMYKIKIRDIVASHLDSNGVMFAQIKVDKLSDEAHLPKPGDAFTLSNYKLVYPSLGIFGGINEPPRFVSSYVRGVCKGTGLAKYIVLPTFYTVYYCKESESATKPLYQWNSFELAGDLLKETVDGKEVQNQWNFGALEKTTVTEGESYKYLVLYNNEVYVKVGPMSFDNKTAPKVEFPNLPCTAKK